MNVKFVQETINGCKLIVEGIEVYGLIDCRVDLIDEYNHFGRIVVEKGVDVCHDFDDISRTQGADSVAEE